MKKLFLIMFPVFICIAILFSLQDRQFSLLEFLNVVSSWEFDNTMNHFVLVADTFDKVGTIWNSFTASDSLWDTIVNIGYLVSNIIKGMGQLILSLGYIIVDLVSNVVDVITWLLGYNLDNVPSLPDSNIVPGGGSGGGGGSPW